MTKRFRIPDGAGGWLLDIPAGQPFELRGMKYSARFIARSSEAWRTKHGVEVYETGRPEPETIRRQASRVELAKEDFLDLVDELAVPASNPISAIDWLREAIQSSYLTQLRKRRAWNLVEGAIVRRAPVVDAALWEDLLFQAAEIEPDDLDEAFLRYAAKRQPN